MQTETMHADVAVIGWGKAGKTIAAKLAAGGTRVVIVEQSDAMVGGTCINIGCVPTKTLLHDAGGRRADDDPQSFFDAAQQRRDSLIAKLNGVNRTMVEQHEQAVVVMGRARFSGERTIEVTAGDDLLTVTADRFVIGTGAVSRQADVPGLDPRSPRVLDSTTAQGVHPLPDHLAIVGAGPIGLEFATMFALFGSRVTLIDRGARLLPEHDEQLSAEVEQRLREQGVEVLHDTMVVEGSEEDDGVRLETDTGSAVTADAVLFAIGRTPATSGLGLEAAGVETDERGAIAVDDLLRTSVEGVWAVGDVNGGPQFTYVSYDDHRIVLPQLLGREPEHTRADRTAVPTTTFMHPPLGIVGLTADAARDAGHAVRVATKPVAKIAAMPRPKAVANTAGRITLVVDADTDLVLGAQLWTIDAQELVNLVALAMRGGVSASKLRDGIWTHPSTTEALNEVLAELD